MYLPRGVPAGGVSAQGVYLSGGVVPAQGVYLPGGGCLPRGGTYPGTPPTVDRQTPAKT